MSVNTVKKWALIIAGFIGVLLLLGFLLLVVLFYLNRSAQHYSACGVIEFQVADDIFRIPPSYIWSVDGLKGCKAAGVNLSAAYPDMSPIIKESSEQTGWGNKVNFGISKRGKQSVGSRAFATREELWQRGQPDVFQDLWIWTPGLSANRQYVMPMDEAYDRVNFSCSTDGSVPYPSCRGFYNYSDDIYFSFSFSKDYLTDWQLITDRLAALVDKFKVTDDLIKEEKEENNLINGVV